MGEPFISSMVIDPTLIEFAAGYWPLTNIFEFAKSKSSPYARAETPAGIESLYIVLKKAGVTGLAADTDGSVINFTIAHLSLIPAARYRSPVEWYYRL